VELHEPDSNFVRGVLLRKNEKKEDGSWESVGHGVPRSLDGVKFTGLDSHTELNILGCILIHGLDPRQFMKRLAACFSLLISQPGEV